MVKKLINLVVCVTVATLSSSLVSIWDSHTRKAQSEETAKDVHQWVDEQRAMLPVSTTVAPVNQKTSGTTDIKVILNFIRDCRADQEKLNQNYDQSLSQLFGDGIMQPDKMDTREKIASVRAKLTVFRFLVDSYQKDSMTLINDWAARISTLPLSAEEIASFQNDYQQGAKREKTLREQIAGIDQDCADKIETLTNFMESRLGKFKVTGGVVYFEDNADVSYYNDTTKQIEELGTNENQIVLQSQQSWKHSLDEIEQEYSSVQ